MIHKIGVQVDGFDEQLEQLVVVSSSNGRVDCEGMVNAGVFLLAGRQSCDRSTQL